MGRTIPSWRIIVEQEIAAMSRFKQFLGPEDRAVFDDLLINASSMPRNNKKRTRSPRLAWWIEGCIEEVTGWSIGPAADARVSEDEREASNWRTSMTN
jgi:hypothetical protein